MYGFRSLLTPCRAVRVQRVFSSKRVKRKQQIRDNTDWHVASDYSWKGKQVYAFGFAATGALGIKQPILPSGTVIRNPCIYVHSVCHQKTDAEIKSKLSVTRSN